MEEFNAAYFPDAGGIAWPTDARARLLLARKVVGLGFVEAHDAWIARAREIIDTTAGALPKAFVKEASIRASLSGLDPEQVSAVQELVKITVHGALFSALVSLDQFPRATLVMEVKADDAEFEPVLVSPTEVDLHDEFSDWLEEFSTEASGS